MRRHRMKYISESDLELDELGKPGGVKASKDELTRQEIRKACEMTSVRALPRIFRTDDVRIQIMWILAIIACTMMTVMQLGNVLMSYVSYPVNVNIIQTQNNPHFPDVTVCRINPYNNDWKGQFTYDEYLRRVDHLENSGKLKYWLDYLANGTDYNAALMYLRSPDGYYSNLYRNDEQLNPADSSLVKSCFYFLWSTNENTGSNINCSDTVIISFSPLFGKCATFHLPAENIQEVRGLVAVMYLEDLSQNVLHFYDEKSMLTVDATGLRVIVHSWGTYPDLALGIDIPPGTETTIDVDETVRIRLPEPYGECLNCQYMTPDCKQQDGALLYSLDACYSLCYQRAVMKNCGCVDSSAAFTEVELNAVNLTMCGNLNLQRQHPKSNDTMSFWDEYLAEFNFTVDELRYSFIEEGLEQLLCLKDMRRNLSQIYCDCAVPCNENQYETRTSYTNWPHKTYELAFYESAIRGNPRYGDQFSEYEELLQENDSGNLSDKETLKRLDSMKLIERNFLRLKVHFGKRGLHFLRDSVSMTWDSLLSNVGGTLSLWVDVTAITLVELLELLYSIIMARWHHRHDPSNPESNNYPHTVSRF